MSSLTIVSLHPYMDNGSLGSSQRDTCTWGRGRGGVGGSEGVGKFPCLAYSVCAALHVEVYGIGNLEKKHLISLFSVLSRLAI